jgi:hypothetical protein
MGCFRPMVKFSKMMLFYFKQIVYRFKKDLFRKIKLGVILFFDFKYRVFKIKKSPIVISFYSDYDDSGYYEQSARILKKRLDMWGIKNEIIELADRGGYQQNCLYKPTFIYQTVLKYKVPVLWIDVDTVVSDPRMFFFDSSFDFIAYSRNAQPDQMLVGFLYFNYNKRSIFLLREWMLHCNYCINNNLSELDHEALKDGVIGRFPYLAKMLFIQNDVKKLDFQSRRSSQVVKSHNALHMVDSVRLNIHEKIKTLCVELKNENDLTKYISDPPLDSFNYRLRFDLSFPQLNEKSNNQLHDLNVLYGDLNT